MRTTFEQFQPTAFELTAGDFPHNLNEAMPVKYDPTAKTGRRPASGHLLRVVILTTPDAQPLDVAGPYEVFALAGKKLRELGGKPDRGYQVEILNMGRSRCITGALGLSILSQGSYRAAAGDVDTLLVVGGMKPWEPVGERPAIEWLRRVAPRVRRVCGVCTGAFVLAEAGLLNGRRATTHWYFTQSLASRYPAVKVDPEPIFVRDGNVYTCAGVTSVMDLALALVEEDFGPEVAVRIARAYVMLLRRPGGQSQFSAPLSFASSSHSPLNRLQLWIFEHLHENLTVARLAARVNMSPRNFARVFRREFQITPGEYLDSVRVEAGRKRLEETPDGVEQIASAVGFGAASTMRRAFVRVLDITPSDYRARFRQPSRTSAHRDDANDSGSGPRHGRNGRSQNDQQANR